jgi:hypothetical protein
LGAVQDLPALSLAELVAVSYFWYLQGKEPLTKSGVEIQVEKRRDKEAWRNISRSGAAAQSTFFSTDIDRRRQVLSSRLRIRDILLLSLYIRSYLQIPSAFFVLPLARSTTS